MLPVFVWTGLSTFLPACGIGDTFTLRSGFSLRMTGEDGSKFDNAEKLKNMKEKKKKIGTISNA